MREREESVIPLGHSFSRSWVAGDGEGSQVLYFSGKLDGATIRVTIGDPRTWDIAKAQAEARRLKVLIDNGQDPRKVKEDAFAAERAARAVQEAAVVAEQEKRMRESVTLGHVWPEYIADRIATREAGWSDHPIAAHRKMIQEGAQPRKRSPALTKAGPLWSLSKLRLVDLTNERVEAWAREEARIRPWSARLNRPRLSWRPVSVSQAGTDPLGFPRQGEISFVFHIC